MLEKEARRDENKRGPGQGVRKSLVQQLQREEGRKKYGASNRKEGERNNIRSEREKHIVGDPGGFQQPDGTSGLRVKRLKTVLKV